jgi:two-component system chemotaxis response regulator CheB
MLNAGRIRRDVVVIGASAGGIEALVALFARLPSDLQATLAVVLHRSPTFEGRLAEVLGRRAALPVQEAQEGDRLRPGAIYIAPRDRHLLIDAGRLRLSGGPREHHTRPAVDPLFVSGARAYGPRVVGVVLSGTGVDGVRGLIAVKNGGGLSLVQDPQEARHATMPVNAITRDGVDAALPVEELAEVLPALASGEAVEVRAGLRSVP